MSLGDCLTGSLATFLSVIFFSVLPDNTVKPPEDFLLLVWALLVLGFLLVFVPALSTGK